MKIKNRNHELEHTISGRREKMNISAIDKIYNYLSGEKDYVDLPETEHARKKGESIRYERSFKCG